MFTSRRLRAALFVFAPLAILVAFATFGFGQATDSNIVGTVTDASGAGVTAAKVTATNKDTGVKYDTTTNLAGEYRLNNIPIGRYDVSATAAGFTTATMADVQLELNHVAPVNLSLAVGTVTTQVDVTESTALIDTSTSQLQATYDNRTAVDVPMAAMAHVVGTSGIWNLSLLGAGVTSSGGVGQGTGPPFPASVRRTTASTSMACATTTITARARKCTSPTKRSSSLIWCRISSAPNSAAALAAYST